MEKREVQTTLGAIWLFGSFSAFQDERPLVVVIRSGT